MKRFLLLFFVFFILLPEKVQAQEFINLVHPVRISDYNKTPLKSLKVEYEEINKRDLPSTWLVSYDVLQNPDLVVQIKEFDDKQEIGVFLEVTPQLARAANVEYKPSDSWHRAKSLFLIGYSQEDRIKLIDALFSQFKGKLGFLPKSVGAWWVDSYSLSYLHKKYGVIANLAVADQFSTDNYSVWGQYWSYPFYPSKLHAGMPATKDNKIGIVTIQWAPRDPLNAYGDSVASKYSSQDYLTLGLSNEYLVKLIKTYALKNSNSFGQATFGLESDLPEDIYSKVYSVQLDTITDIAKEKNIQFLTMEEFGRWFSERFQDTPSALVGGKDLLGTEVQSYFFQTPNYRIGIKFSPINKSVEIVDFRVYQKNFQEPFYTESIDEHNLFINIPSVVDKINDSETAAIIENVESFHLSKKLEVADLTLSGGKEIHFKNETILFNNFSKNELLKISKSPYLTTNSGKDIEIKINENFPISSSGLSFNNLSVESIYFFLRPKVKIITLFIALLFTALFLVAVFSISKSKIGSKILVTMTFAILCAISALYLILNTASNKYIVSQGEFDALIHLRLKPQGSVVVDNSRCLVCTDKKRSNPAYGNIRDYIGIISEKKLIYDGGLFEIDDHKKVSNYFNNLSSKYIYISKDKGFNNTLKLSPGDYGIKKIFENSSSQIWQSN